MEQIEKHVVYVLRSSIFQDHSCFFKVVKNTLKLLLPTYDLVCFSKDFLEIVLNVEAQVPKQNEGNKTLDEDKVDQDPFLFEALAEAPASNDDL